MRVLWFVNIAFPALNKNTGLKVTPFGGWMYSLSDLLTGRNDIELTIACTSSDIEAIEHYNFDGINYVILPDYKRQPTELKGFDKYVGYCLRAIDSYKPDLVEVYGTERYFGLIGDRTGIPVIIRIQGVMNEIVKYFFGPLKFSEITRYPSLVRIYLRYKNQCKIEKEIFLRNKIYNGRSFWAESVLHDYVVDPIYFHVDTVLRPQFYAAKWDINKANRNTIYCTSKLHSYKGVDVLIRALRILKKSVPTVSLRIAGHIPDKGFGRYLFKLVQRLGLEKNVCFVGQIGPDDVALEIERAHAYVLPSFIENTPQSLAEAQVVGCPSVASYTGGVPTYAANGKAALMFPRGDHAVLAARLSKLLENDELASELSERGRNIARNRHDPKTVLNALLSQYEKVLCGNLRS
ncbi:glycosyltransferase [uncultured Desulfosarcina sp.]|uniref:glycosyltransferase family 4 protein n=1 Tax=uncultured Desulfosarcina sp. TaxID=218289 RepID=UPI0029C98A7F|nr:glycosyltransferase [uncultured Desulfosarcina sp.]